jgi:hypothetical protein
MVLQYKFEYLSNNHTLCNFLIRIAQEKNITYEITKQGDFIYFYVQAQQEELEMFSQYLSEQLPMSIFLKNTYVEVVEEMPNQGIKKQIHKEPTLPFCPKCLAQVEDESSSHYYNPFITCEFCDSAHGIEKLSLLWNETQKLSTQYKELFAQVAQQLYDGLSVQIKTFSGTFVVKRFEHLKEEPIQEELEFFCTNLMNISKVFIAQKSEVVALASLEKPQISLKVNEIFKHKNIIKTTHVKVRFASDLLLYLLNKELTNLGIDFLHIVKDSTYDVSLQPHTSDTFNSIAVPTIQIVQNDRLILLNNPNYDNKLNQIYTQFDDKNKGHFMVLLQENDLFEKSILNFYASEKHDDNISLYTNELGSFLDVLNYTLPESIPALFEEMSHDETGKRLVENYKKQYGEIFQKAMNYDITHLNKQSIVSFWEIVQVVLGFDNTVLNSAMVCLLEKGPRIDYKLHEQEKLYNKSFHFVKLIQSGMSFKLAGVEQNTIALGYVESYAHFISSIVDEVNDEINLDGISLTGSIFANNLISNFVHKSITKNYKIYYNKDFVIQAS